MHSATFVLSTGRCGTQWLARQLGEAHGNVLTVEHEPLHNGYQPRRMLGIKSPAALEPGAARLIVEHAEGIERCLETRSYVECGHPCWSTLPYLSERLAGRIRILHLIRHPIPTALSWLTHSAYQVPLLPHLQEKVLLSPFDEGIAFPEYRERWVSMTPFEKCLYYWAEVNTLGLRLEQAARFPWLRVSFEELFEKRGIRPILDFLGLEERGGVLERSLEVVDRHRFKAASFPDLGLLASHPRIIEVATNLGYAPSWEDIKALRERYELPGF